MPDSAMPENITDPDKGLIVRELWIAATPETVFPYFTETQKILQWQGVEAEIDPRPGGIFRLNVTGKNIARGEYVEVSPPHRVVYTWGWEGGEGTVPPGASTVTVTLTAEAGGTRLRFEHSGLTDTATAGHSEGWDFYLARFVKVMAGEDPGPQIRSAD